MNSILETIGRHALLPILTLEDAGAANAVADALVAGGLPLMEVTFRTAAAESAIRTIANRKDVTIGAGTVLSVDLVKRAVAAGASFMVTPGFNPKVVQYCIDNRIPITPGTITPTDVDQAREMGLEVVKFFPAESFGGLSTMKAIAAPLHMMKFIPTGGISEKQLPDYLGFKATHAVGGSWFASKDQIAAGRWAEITENAKRAVETVRRIRG